MRYEVYEASGHVLISVDPRPGSRPQELDGIRLRPCLIGEGDLAGVERFVLDEKARLKLRRFKGTCRPGLNPTAG